LKKLNMIWRGESARRCAQPAQRRRERQAALQCGMQGAGSRTFYQARRRASYRPNGQGGRAAPLW